MPSHPLIELVWFFSESSLFFFRTLFLNTKTIVGAITPLWNTEDTLLLNGPYFAQPKAVLASLDTELVFSWLSTRIWKSLQNHRSPHSVSLASFAVPYLCCATVTEQTGFISQISCYIFAIHQSLPVFVLSANSISREWLLKSEGPRTQLMRLTGSPKTVLCEDLSVGKIVRQYCLHQHYYLYQLNLYMFQHYKIIWIGSVFNKFMIISI